MKKNLVIHFLVALMVFASCKKQELPKVESETPKFYVTALQDGEPFTLEAGNGDYYMFSSNYMDSLSKMDVYKAELKQRTCGGTCANALTVLINDTKLSQANGTMDVENALALGTHLYNDLTTKPHTYTTSFKPEKPYHATSTYSWHISDGETNSSFSTYSINPSLKAEKKYTITLTYNDATGCQSTHSNVYRVGNPLQASIEAVRLLPESEFKYAFSAKINSTNGSLTYLWDFGDGSTLSTEQNPTHKFNISSNQYKVKLLVVSNAKDTCESYIQINASPDSDCSANYTATLKPVFNPLLFGSVTVLLSDANGEVYSSDGFIQPNESKFEILRRESYDSNNKLEPTKKLTVKFNCILKNGSKTKTLTNAEAVLAVSYK